VIDDQMHPVMELKAWWIACVLSPTCGFCDIRKDCLHFFTQSWEVSTKFCFLCSRKESAFWSYWSCRGYGEVGFFFLLQKRDGHTETETETERQSQREN
jgi:hypothetical protein